MTSKQQLLRWAQQVTAGIARRCARAGINGMAGRLSAAADGHAKHLCLTILVGENGMPSFSPARCAAELWRAMREAKIYQLGDLPIPMGVEWATNISADGISARFVQAVVFDPEHEPMVMLRCDVIGLGTTDGRIFGRVG